MAAVMGNDGRPTEIDFNNQYVIAVSKPVTDRLTELEPVSLKGDGDGGLVFVYRTKAGQQLSYSMQPSLVVVVDKKYRGMVSIREEKWADAQPAEKSESAAAQMCCRAFAL